MAIKRSRANMRLLRLKEIEKTSFDQVMSICVVLLLPLVQSGCAKEDGHRDPTLTTTDDVSVDSDTAADETDSSENVNDSATENGDSSANPDTDVATDSDEGEETDSGDEESDRDGDGIPDASDICPEDNLNNCLANDSGDFDGDGLANGDESGGCGSDAWSECAETISKLNEMNEQIAEEGAEIDTSSSRYEELKNGDKDCEELVREFVNSWNQRAENAEKQKAPEDYYYICGWKARAAINHTEPVFDFDGDGCLPSAGFDENGDMNSGLSPTGSITGGCRDDHFLDSATTLHRFACVREGSTEYCGHFYALYFQKDQITALGGGHRHDWEYAAVWTKDGVVTHGSASAHGDLDTKAASELEFEDTHLKIVYHKDGLLTHAFRFADPDEIAENPYHLFVTPPIVSWYELEVNGLTREQMRERLNSFDYGSATIPSKDSNFLENLNEFKPSSYPNFDEKSVQDANPFP